MLNEPQTDVSMIVPKQDYVLIEKIAQAETFVTKSGLHLQSENRGKPSELFKGKILAVGPGSHTQHGTLIPLDVKVGDIAIYSKYVEGDVPGHVNIVLARETNILAILKSQPNSDTQENA